MAIDPLRRAFLPRVQRDADGRFVVSMDGREYRIDEDGSRRRARPKVNGRHAKKLRRQQRRRASTSPPPLGADAAASGRPCVGPPADQPPATPGEMRDASEGRAYDGREATTDGGGAGPPQEGP